MSETRQQLKLKLEGDRLYVSRLRKQSGHFGKREGWKIQKKSNLPRSLYFVIHNFVRQRIQNREDDSFSATKKTVLRGLCEAALACGCEAQFGKEGGAVCWYLNGDPIFAVQIHDGELDKLRLKHLRKGNAIFRWAITVQKGGYLRYHARRTRIALKKGMVLL
jgi:hypothetical protein